MRPFVWGVRVAVLVLFGACANLFGAQVARWVDRPQVQERAPFFPRRDECLRPPFTLGAEPGLQLGPWKVEPRGSGPRELTFAAASGATAAPDALLEWISREGPSLRALDGVQSVGLSGCPSSAGKPVPCVALSVELCAQPLPQLAEAFSAAVSRDPATRGLKLVFHVSLVGSVAPRCESLDPKCRPEPYGAAWYQPSQQRGLLAEPTADSEESCHSDGECAKSGCGGDCLPWTQSHRVGRCDDRTWLREAFCGCVEHRCAWFVQ